MKRQSIFVLVLAGLIGAAVVLYLERGRPAGEPGKPRPVAMKYTDVFREAATPVDPATLGKAWVEDADMAALRAEWHTLGAPDSTMMEKLALDWIYPESQGPFRLTNVTQTPHGALMTIDDRMKLAQTLLKHPTWRLGSMRHFPAAAAVLSSNEKCVLQFLGLDGAKAPQSLADLHDRLRLPEEELQRAVEDLASVGWIQKAGDADSVRYTVTDPAIAKTGGLSFLNFDPEDGRTFDVASFGAVLNRRLDDFQKGRVTLYGNCAETGRLIYLSIASGKFNLGRPGQAVAADVGTPGLSNGIFASKRAYDTWKAAHPNVTVSGEMPIPAYFRAAVERS